MQISTFQIGPIDIGNLQLASGGWLKGSCDIYNIVVIKIEAGDRHVRFWLNGLLLDRHGAVVLVEFDYPVVLRSDNLVAEYGRSRAARTGAGEHFRQTVAVEDIITKDQGDWICPNKIAANDES